MAEVGGPIQQMFDEIDFSFIEQIETSDFYFPDNDWSDCTLSDEEITMLLTPSLDDWNDIQQSESPSIFKIDDAKKKNWNNAKLEISHLKKRIADILGDEIMGKSKNEINQAIIFEILGPNKEVARYLCDELELSIEKYCAFMQTFTVQAAYRVSSTELFEKHSLLKESVAMEKEEYLNLWSKLSELKRVPQHQMRNSTSPVPLWQEIEKITNMILKKFTIIGWEEEGDISISLDDDKVWFACSRVNTVDLFNVKYTTHTQANRKGLVAHSAISSGHMTPMAISVERTKDSAVRCMKRMLTNLFDSNGNVEMNGVNVHSDRGYMIREIVDFLLENGANFTGTVKRLLNCWPFTYNQKIDPEKDTRTVVDVKGAPTLFMKYCIRGVRRLQASAFRNGSQAVATALSSLHNGHEWEGTVMKPSDHARWLEDDEALREDFFKPVDLGEGIFFEGEENDVNDDLLLTQIILGQIEPMTLLQGTADWHWLRKFSLTSSQANGAFEKAFSLFNDDEDWITVAKYLYGERNYREKLLVDAMGSSVEEQQNDSDQEQEDGNGEAITFFHFISNYHFPNDADDDHLVAARWLENNATIEYHSNSQEAKDTLALLSSNQKKEVKKILQLFDPYNIGQMKAPDPLKWLVAAIPERDVLFYKSNDLKKIMKQKDLQFSEGGATIDKMIKAISGTEIAGVESISHARTTESKLYTYE